MAEVISKLNCSYVDVLPLITNVVPHCVVCHIITVLQLIRSFWCVKMWRLLLIVAVLGAVTVQFPSVLAVKGLMYMRQIDSMLDEFLSSGDNLKVVYFGRGTWCKLYLCTFMTFSSSHKQQVYIKARNISWMLFSVPEDGNMVASYVICRPQTGELISWPTMHD